MPREKNIVVLYDEKFSHIKTVNENIESFKKYSRNNVFYLPATIYGSDISDGHYFKGDSAKELIRRNNSVWNFELFDAVIIHYSVRLAIEGYLAPVLQEALVKYAGEKILFIQDEYDNVLSVRKGIKELGITTIFTCVPPSFHEVFYPRRELPGVRLCQTLTGFVPGSSDIEEYAVPVENREVLIGYRGRMLPHHYGMLGYEKYIIGERMREESKKRGLNVDIESDDSKRIYGSWYAFLGSCRATLGTESGANIVDFDGSLKDLAAALADRPFEEVYDQHFKAYEGMVHMNQISPKFFEAIKLGTALVCFPGTYSGILKADRHYIPLAKDFSNIEDVFRKLQDLPYLKQVTARAYEEIVASGRYGYSTFVAGFDDLLDKLLPYGKYEIISAPIALRNGETITPLVHDDPRDKIINSTILGGAWQRQEFSQLFRRKSDFRIGLPGSSRVKKLARSYALDIQEQKSSGFIRWSVRVLRPFWRLMPERIRRQIGTRLFP